MNSLPESGFAGGIYPSWDTRYQALLIGDDSGGFVVAALDGDGETKGFNLRAESGSIQAGVKHFRPEIISSSHAVP